MGVHRQQKHRRGQKDSPEKRAFERKEWRKVMDEYRDSLPPQVDWQDYRTISTNVEAIARQTQGQANNENIMRMPMSISAGLAVGCFFLEMGCAIR
jgi:hypothetical protein